MAKEQWYSVRCIFEMPTIAALNDVPEDMSLYEERVTIWRAASFEEAIALAEQEATEYAGPTERYLGLAQAYALEAPPAHGAEVFSLLRNSRLDGDAYLSTFFDTGGEEQDERETAD